MQRLDDMIRALGEPVSRRPIGDPATGAVVARWRHGYASIPLRPDATTHVVLSLSRGESATYKNAGSCERYLTEVGRVGLMPKREAVVAEIGPADAFHIFLPASLTAARAAHRTQVVGHSAEDMKYTLRRHALEIFVAARQPDPDADLRLDAGLAGLTLAITGTSDRRHPGRSVGGLTPTARRRIDDLVAARVAADCAAPPSLGEMADAARLSIDHFVRMFRHDTGATPYLYASRRRLERAMTLLTQPAMSIGDVAHRTGFCSPSHFVATFRTHMGVTPASFRDTVRG